MRYRRHIACGLAAIGCVAVVAISAAGQTIDFLSESGPIGPIVRGAPFSGEGLTTLTNTLHDGTRIERRVTMKLHRDSAGRVRREQTIVGLAALNPSSESLEIVTIVDPVEGFTYVLNPSTRTARRAPMDRRALAGATRPPPPPPAPPPTVITEPGAPPPPLPSPSRPEETSLGTREIEGIVALGTRRTLMVPVGAIGNDRAIEIIDERWVSRDLRVLLQSRHQDPRTGDVTFRLTNVNRTEPALSLFRVPPGYTVTDAPPQPR